MTTPHWTWGLSTAVILALVIWLNGHQIRAGWLLGATVQLINVTFGWLVYSQPTFLFLLLPAGMFVFIWWKTGRKAKAVMPRLVTTPLREMTAEEVEQFCADWERAAERREV